VTGIKALFTHVVGALLVIGCPDLYVPENAWLQRMGDNVMIRCNDTQETWYFSCQRSRWIGDVGNCSQSQSSSICYY